MDVEEEAIDLVEMGCNSSTVTYLLDDPRYFT